MRCSAICGAQAYDCALSRSDDGVPSRQFVPFSCNPHDVIGRAVAYCRVENYIFALLLTYLPTSNNQMLPIILRLR